jgi:hypothetical protein
MPDPALLYARRNNAWENSKRLAESWAKDIRKAFLERKPCPIIPAKGFELELELAFDLAQVPVGCLEEMEPIEEEVPA